MTDSVSFPALRMTRKTREVSDRMQHGGGGAKRIAGLTSGQFKDSHSNQSPGA